MRDAPRQLTERIDFLRLPQLRFGLRQARLIAKPVSDVMHKLKRTDELAVAIAQGIKFHLVVTAVQVGITKLVHRSEFLAGKGAAPIIADNFSLVRRTFEKRQQVIA